MWHVIYNQSKVYLHHLFFCYSLLVPQIIWCLKLFGTIRATWQSLKRQWLSAHTTCWRKGTAHLLWNSTEREYIHIKIIYGNNKVLMIDKWYLILCYITARFIGTALDCRATGWEGGYLQRPNVSCITTAAANLFNWQISLDLNWNNSSWRLAFSSQ